MTAGQTVVVVTQHSWLEYLQLIATFALTAAAVFQALSARKQAAAADEQVLLATKPKLVPRELKELEAGCEFFAANEGSGTAYHLRWRFDKETNWAVSDAVLPQGKAVRISIPYPQWRRRIVIEYWSGKTRRFESVLDLSQFGDYEYKDDVSKGLLDRIRKASQKEGASFRNG
jgi:hypothetical protein